MKRTNHRPMLAAAIGCFIIALASIPASVALFKLTFSGRVSDEHFAMFFFIACCLAVLGFVTALSTIGAFFDWGELFIQSLEERSEVDYSQADVQIVYVRQGNTYVPVRVSRDNVIPVERRLR
jgi:hypothetical protein